MDRVDCVFPVTGRTALDQIAFAFPTRLHPSEGILVHMHRGSAGLIGAGSCQFRTGGLVPPAPSLGRSGL